MPGVESVGRYRPEFAPPLDPYPATPPGWNGHADPPSWPQPYGRPPGKVRWTVDAPPGTPYQRLARTPAQRWWRPVLGTAAILVAGLTALVPVMIVWVLVEAAIQGVDPGILFEALGEGGGPLLAGDNSELAFTLVSLAVFLPFIPLAAWGLQRRRPGTLSSVAGRIRWRWLGTCAGLAVGATVVSFALAWAVSPLMDEPADEGAWVGWGAFVAPLLIVVLLVPFQATAEEYFFRGWLLQSIASCTLEGRTGGVARRLAVVFRTPWPAICLTSALFVAGHGYTGWGILDIFCFGVIAAWLAIRTGGLEASIALHVINNVVAFLFPAALGLLDLEQGSIALPAVVADVLPLLLYAALVARLADRRALQTVTAPAQDPAAAPATP
ncbi:CPBP family intramembrane glutamic endopeptidase [Thermomonospora umbrina]|uniref:Membrane protease YdiL (CAAX protease family) n=1 Tax=Thermomonospora umbrina TaxID=111806 RepID=A0A3D9SN87_9ACTN|nr:CPBP family intramembrane glutamic endopeptidase [Thermomonospora umbrina]REE95890.1 membrane protease YdiL (CAAX protease family) [Thermomonospora umbrina]